MSFELNTKKLDTQKEKVITFEKVEDRLKNKSLNEYTDKDIFDRYIVYRNRRRIKQS